MPPGSMRAAAAALPPPETVNFRKVQLNPKDNITVGKYLISPLTQLLGNGWYACSVSIRSGSGSGTHDRVLRLTRLFQTKLAAVRYATAEGLKWIGHPHTTVQGAALAGI